MDEPTLVGVITSEQAEAAHLPPWTACGGVPGSYDASDLQSPTTLSAMRPPL